MIYRTLTIHDREAAKRLWQACFPEDSDAFTEWYFARRFCPALSAGCFSDNNMLVSVIHGTYMPLYLNGETVPALMVSGVGTAAAHRARGYMHNTMLFLQNEMRKKGIPILFNHPQNPNGYIRLGFCPLTQVIHFSKERAFFADKNENCSVTAFDTDIAFNLYTKIAREYTASVQRDAAAFLLRIEDCLLDGGKGAVLISNGLPFGYALYHGTSEIICDEIACIEEADYKKALKALILKEGGERITAELPPRTGLPGKKELQNIMLAETEILSRFLHEKKRYCFDTY